MLCLCRLSLPKECFGRLLSETWRKLACIFLHRAASAKFLRETA